MFYRSTMFAALLLALAARPSLAQDKLPQGLKVTQLQGGFAGFTGFRYTISPEGEWRSEELFNERATQKAKGRLSPEDIAKLAKLLAKVEAGKLPEKAGKAPGANPFSITIELGTMKATWVGAEQPKVNANNPAASVESRFGAVWQTVRMMAMPPLP